MSVKSSTVWGFKRPNFAAIAATSFDFDLGIESHGDLDSSENLFVKIGGPLEGLKDPRRCEQSEPATGLIVDISSRFQRRGGASPARNQSKRFVENQDLAGSELGDNSFETSCRVQVGIDSDGFRYFAEP